MGGKRPDQYNIDPAEGSSTNHTWRGEGRSGDEKIDQENKRRERQTEIDDRRRAMNAGDEAADAERARKVAKIPKGSDEESEAQIDEGSKESFPASDPPRQP